MKEFALATSICLALALLVQGQSPTKTFSAPIAWTEYRVNSQKVSVNLPKLPVARTWANPCAEMDTGIYHAYADGIVYEFEWYAKKRHDAPVWCPAITKFSKTTFTDRIEELKKQNWAYEESDVEIAGLPAKVLRSTLKTGAIAKTRWLVWEKDRWFELGITNRKESAVDEARFIGGLKLKSSVGIDIRDGAEGTLGDPDADTDGQSTGKTTTALSIVSKPRPSYTDEARRSNTQGTVVLRVTFLKNGGVGLISATKELPHGLTEQAIKAARRIAFVPSTVDGKATTVVKLLEYSFSIY